MPFPLAWHFILSRAAPMDPLEIAAMSEGFCPKAIFKQVTRKVLDSHELALLPLGGVLYPNVIFRCQITP